jgi:hypothetical protein
MSQLSMDELNTFLTFSKKTTCWCIFKSTTVLYAIILIDNHSFDSLHINQKVFYVQTYNIMT